MKTTLEIRGVLLQEAELLARRDGLTVREIVEHGLELAIAERRRPMAFRLFDASVPGHGLHPEAEELGWDQLRKVSRGEREL